MLAVVHDLTEAQGESTVYLPSCVTNRRTIKVGDIAPRENIPKEEKRRLEAVSLTSSIN